MTHPVDQPFCDDVLEGAVQAASVSVMKIRRNDGREGRNSERTSESPVQTKAHTGPEATGRTLTNEPGKVGRSFRIDFD